MEEKEKSTKTAPKKSTIKKASTSVKKSAGTKATTSKSKTVNKKKTEDKKTSSVKKTTVAKKTTVVSKTEKKETPKKTTSKTVKSETKVVKPKLEDKEIENKEVKQEVIKEEVIETPKKVEKIEIKETKEIKAVKRVNKKMATIVGILLLVIILCISLFVVLGNNKKNSELSGIDKNNPTYQGKPIYEQDGNTIIEEENGSKTIETKKEEDKYIEATEEIKNKYVISDVSYEKQGASTIVKGKIKNNGSKYNSAYVNVKFKTGNLVKGSASVLVEKLGNGKSSNFEIKILGTYENSEKDIYVQYVK